MTDYLEYTGNPYFLPENREGDARTGEQEIASLPIPDKARSASWEAVQSVIRVAVHKNTRERLYGHPVASGGHTATREPLNDRLNTGAS